MGKFAGWLVKINGAAGEFLWGRIGLAALLLCGGILTLLTRGFQIRYFGHCVRQTIGRAFRERSAEQGAISPFQAMCTALAACVGVGNIAGVATAIAAGGAGAVFWMWIAAVFGMMTAYAENLLGGCYRRRMPDGEWTGGPMYYLRDGLGGMRGCKTLGRVLAAVFAFSCILASFGIGNMTQVGTIAENLPAAFPLPLSDIKLGASDLYCILIGIVLMIAEGILILGGVRRIAAMTAKIVPVMVLLYFAGSLCVIFSHTHLIIPALGAIFRGAFGLRPAAGGAIGYTVKTAMEWGVKRGIFSNEAGLGSAVMVNSASDEKEPVRQGLWAIFEVFMDTIVMCTVTALLLLCSGLYDLSNGCFLTDARTTTLVAQAFSGVFSGAGSAFVALCILLFAFSTVLGWSCYGMKACEYLFGRKGCAVYQIFYISAVFLGAVTTPRLIWQVSDIFNALMMLPNLIGVLALSGKVRTLTNEYVVQCEKKKQKNIKKVEKIRRVC